MKKDKKERKKKDKPKYIDDGHTVYNMDGVQSPFGSAKKGDGNGMTKKEKRAAIRAALQVYLPYIFGAILCFTLVGLLMYLWLRQG